MGKGLAMGMPSASIIGGTSGMPAGVGGEEGAQGEAACEV